RDVAAQSRRQMAYAARGSGRAYRASATDPAQRCPPRSLRRAPRLRDMLVAARGRRGADGSFSCGRARFFAAACRAGMGRDDRRRLAGRRRLSAADPGAARHRRLLCRDLRTFRNMKTKTLNAKDAEDTRRARWGLDHISALASPALERFVSP